MGAWTIEVGGSSRRYSKIDFDRSLGMDPTEFTATVEYNAGISYFDTVAIKNGATTEWYGYVETITPAWDKDKLVLKLWGRDRLVILWKKFTERFSDSRLDGFFGSTDPAKLIYFLLRCPISDAPTTSSLSKIGWGLDPSDWACSGIRTSTAHDPDWVWQRRQGLAWELGPVYKGHAEKITSWTATTDQWAVSAGAKGTIMDDDDYTTYIQAKYYTLLAADAPATQTYVDVNDASQFAQSESVRISNQVASGVHGGNHETATISSISIGGGAGGSDRINLSAGLTNSYTTANGSGVLKRYGITDEYWSMDDLDHTSGKITASYIYLWGRHVDNSWGSGTDATVKIHVYDGSSWHDAGTVTWADGVYGYGGWANVLRTKDISSYIDTFTKANACRVKLEQTSTDATAGMARISEIRLIVTGYSYQTTGDWFKIDLGASKNRVTGIYVESRRSSDRFPVNYKIQTSNTGAFTGEEVDRVTVTSNPTRDIVESWAAADSVRYIRIYITSGANYGWQISQVYVYLADTKKYCALSEGSGTAPNQYLGTITLGNYVTAEDEIKPLNLGFGRLNENIEKVLEKCNDTNYDTWEAWVDHNDGEFHFAARKGSDLSSSISFVKADEVGGITKEGDCRGCETRVKVVGKAEGKAQDEITSDWKINTTGESAISSFYEKIVTAKQIADKDTADVLANVHQRSKGNVQETIEVKVNYDPYSSMAYDVGDDVTVTDSLTGTSGAHRIHSLHKTITKGKGCETTLYVGEKWEDVTNEWAEIKRLVRSLAGSGAIIQDWFAEGAEQDKVDATKVTDLWEKTATNDESTPPADETDSDWNITGDGSWSQVFQCTENWFLMKGSKDAGNQRTLEAIAYNDEGVGIRFNQNPKFLVVVKILEDGTDPTTGATDWMEDDFCEIMMDNGLGSGSGWKGAGFYIIRRNGLYELWFGIVDAGGQQWKKAHETAAGTTVSIDTLTKFRLEARVKWTDEDGTALDSKFVEFYYNNELLGIVLFDSSETGTSTMYPVGATLLTSNPVAAVQCWAQLYFYKWKCEWRWAA